MRRRKIKVFALWTAPAPYSVAWLGRLSQSPELDLLVAYQWTLNPGHPYWNLPIRFKHVHLDSHGWLKGIRGVPKLFDLLSAFRPHVVFLHDLLGALPKFLWAWCVLTGIPYVMYGDANAKKKIGRLKWIRNKLLLSLLVRLARRVVVIGTSNTRFWRRWGSTPRKEVLATYSVDTDVWLNAANRLLPNRKTLRKQMGLGANEKLFLFVGRLHPVKGIDLLVEAVRNLCTEGSEAPRFKVFLAGDGPDRENLSSLIRKYGLRDRIRLLGPVQQCDLAEYYAAADWLVLPSRNEPWGLVINEALCFGVPVVASDVVGAVEDLVADGTTGFIFRAEDVGSLCRALKKALLLPPEQYRKMSECARAIINRWNIQTMVRGLKKAILEAAGRKWCKQDALGGLSRP